VSAVVYSAVLLVGIGRGEENGREIFAASSLGNA